MITKKEFEKLVKQEQLTMEDKIKLEPYRVKRAVIMAAGLGSRLRPLTYDRPKPLLKVKGIRIIDTILDALYANDITDIYIIRGYLGEQFDELIDKYPRLHMLNNLLYSEGNNILSACLAGNLIERSYVMPADIYINNQNVFPKYQYNSNVLGYKISKTEDWCIETDHEGKIIRLSPGGEGEGIYKDTGIFYWNEEQGSLLARDIMKVCCQQNGWSKYWSNVCFEIYKEHYNSYIRECGENDVIEIDTIDDLKGLNSSHS